MTIRNVSLNEHCTCETGYVITAWRPFGPGRLPEYGPCPHCEAGAAVEFKPSGKKHTWGDDGYWQGRAPSVPPAPTREFRLPDGENKLRLRLLNRRLAGEPVDPCVGIDHPEPRRRIELLERASA